MTVVTFKIPDGKVREVSNYVAKAGGEKLMIKQQKDVGKEEDDDEVTHEVFFGENIKRLFKAFSK